MDLAEVAPAFVEMAHRIVWCSAATVDPNGRPRSRVLHPIWVLDDSPVTGWIATSPTPLKVAHLDAHPYVSCTYLAPNHDTCTAECAAELVYDDETRTEVWERFKNAPAPVGYDPAIVPVWTGPTGPEFVAMKLTPWRLRVMPGTLMLAGKGDLLTWQA
jgi:general stress protein 26